MGIFDKIMPRDIIAMIALVGSFTLKWGGADGVVSAVIISIVAFYFGAEIFKNRERI